MMYQYPFILGVDPDSRHDGVCLLGPGGDVQEVMVLPHGVEERGAFKPFGDAVLARRIEAVLVDALDLSRKVGGRLVLGIEGQFIAKNWKSTMAIIDVRRAWEVLAARVGVAAVRLLASEWRSLVFPGTPVTTKREVWKRLAEDRLMRDALPGPWGAGSVRVSNDAADAYCIALAVRMRERGCKV